METPIWDFVTAYAERDALRLHMPGHKGRGPLGVEERDITEIPGADVLYPAAGIIRRSEENAAALFGTARTLYSAEGSSLCIRAMLYLALLWGKDHGRPPLILAGRNAHKTFFTAAALLDLDVAWLWPERPDAGALSCPVTAAGLERALLELPEKPAAVYLTSPDYLGNTVDTAALAAVCRRQDVLLIVDNAHGAYLRFLPTSRHPMDLGADLCCDSAHKTLPVITGGAYLHIARGAPAMLCEQAESALSLFASTSPSYLILQSMDLANRALAGDYRERLAAFVRQTDAMKTRLTRQGWRLLGDEPLKLTVDAAARGYTGPELAEHLRQQGIVREHAGPDGVVFLLTPEIGEEGLRLLEDALTATTPRPPLNAEPPAPTRPERACSIRQALLSPQEPRAVADSAGRILAMAAVGCPPAVPIVAAGERLGPAEIDRLLYYGVTRCLVTAEPFDKMQAFCREE